jgi:hypothetical protein
MQILACHERLLQGVSYLVINKYTVYLCKGWAKIHPALAPQPPTSIVLHSRLLITWVFDTVAINLLASEDHLFT